HRPSQTSTRVSERFDRFQDLRRMPWNLNPPPLAGKLPVRCDQKRRPLDAPHLPAVHVLHLDHTKLLAQHLIRIRDQLERESQLCLEAFVRLETVTRDSDDNGTGFDESLVQISELAAFRRASRGVVLGVEVHDYWMPALI